MILWWLVVFLVVGTLSNPAVASEIFQPRVANDTLRLPRHIPVTGYGLVNAFPSLKFDQPVALATPPLETNRLFVVERTGAIYVITNLAQPSKTLFLDLSRRVDFSYSECGLLGLAFHPGFATNRFFFVFVTKPWTDEWLHEVVLRFKVSSNPNRADDASELPILAQADDNNQHNGGDLKFGPDGYLYVSMGERVNRDLEWIDQTPIDRDLQGAILRIDVDGRPGNLSPNPHPASSTNYWIPADNPFVGVIQYHGQAVNPAEVRTELYAIGFRNPWRMTFDFVTGDLYVADVGDSREEEVNVVTAGGDYGWPYREGHLSRAYNQPPEFDPLPPLHAYEHGWHGGTNGDCVIGGLVYRGRDIPWLEGRYLFGDFRSGYIWSAQRQGDGAEVDRLVDTTMGLSSFGADPRNGEVLITHVLDGTILRLVYRPPGMATNIPPTLADTGIFEDLASLTPHAGIEPYEINVPFWSDHAIKRRWFSLPQPDQTIEYNPDGVWTFPTGAVWIKHFELELTNGVPSSARRLETRILVHAKEGFYGLTYRWGESITNALLVPAEGQVERFTIRDQNGAILRQQDWRYPARADCMNCHSKSGGYALGFNTAQLNRTVMADEDQPTNQLLALGAAGYLAPPPSQAVELPALARDNDADAPLEFRVRSYFEANCVSCHVVRDLGVANWDARLTTPLDEAGLVSENGVISPGSLHDSRLYQRLLGLPRLMPPIATTVQNSNAINLIAEWITTLPPKPWLHRSIGDVIRFGGSTVSNNVFRVGGTGLSLNGSEDAFQFISQPLDLPAAQFIVRLEHQSSSNKQALAGLMVRKGSGTSDPFLMAACRSDGVVSMLRREFADTVTLSTGAELITLPQWLRLVRLGNDFKMFRSGDGTNWTMVGTASWADPGPFQVGLAVNSGSLAQFNNAIFDRFSSLSVALTSSIPPVLEQPADVTLRASVESSGRKVARVEFYDEGIKVGESLGPPYTITVSDFSAGEHTITARVIDEAGAVVVSEPWGFFVRGFPSLATPFSRESSFRGNWPGHYGADGYVIVNYQTNLPPFVTVSPIGVTALTWSSDTQAQRALVTEGTNSRIAAAWTAPTSFTVSIKVRDDDLHRLSLYFLDWESVNRRTQLVELLDPTTGIVLASREISSFGPGAYLTSTIRGSVDVRITRLSGFDPVLSGIFLDQSPNLSPAVSLSWPSEGQSFTLPSEIALEASATDQDGQIQRVEFYLDETWVGASEHAPFTLTLTNVTEGAHTVVARAYDNLGVDNESLPVSFQAVLPRAKAAFLHADLATRGDWQGRYGTTGFMLPNLTNWWPAGFSISTDGSVFSEFGFDRDYLQTPWPGIRIFPLLYSFTDVFFDLNLADGRPRTLALYFFDDRVYSEWATILDPATGQVLDAQVVTNGHGGCYLVWQAQGHLWLRVSNPVGGSQARVSALFLDPFTSAPPQVDLLQPAADVDVETPVRILLAAQASAPDGLRSVEFHTLTGKIGESVQAPYEFLWEFPVAGTHQVFARAISAGGAVTDSEEVTVRVAFSAPSEVRFVQSDTYTMGDWRGSYGTEGYWMPTFLNYSNLPPTISVINTQAWVDVFSDSPQALAAPNAITRMFSFWYGASTWQMRVRLNDGRPHRVSLYNCALDRTNAVTVTIRSPGSDLVLDVREIPSQEVGTYLTWDIQGDAVFEFATSPGSSSFVNAIFLDPIPSAFADWQGPYFTLTDRANSAISGKLADPDRDGYNNWMEYLLRLDPRRAETTAPLWFEREGDAVSLHLKVAPGSEADSVSIEASSDLQYWTDPIELRPSSSHDQGDHIERRYAVTVNQDQAQFYRLKIHLPW